MNPGQNLTEEKAFPVTRCGFACRKSGRQALMRIISHCHVLQVTSYIQSNAGGPGRTAGPRAVARPASRIFYTVARLRKLIADYHFLVMPRPPLALLLPGKTNIVTR